MCDGTIKHIGGQSYSTYRSDFNTRKTTTSPLQIGLTGSYNTGTRQGNVNAHITNTSGSSVNGTLQCILTETDKFSGGDSFFNIARDMIPNQNGEVVTIPAGGAIDKAKSFTVNSSWNANKCDIVVFVQTTDKVIQQAAKVRITTIPAEENETKTGDEKLKISPNPFNYRTIINYSLSSTNTYKLTIYDLAGRTIRTWNLNNLNSHEIAWDGSNEIGQKVNTGIYLCVLSSGEHKVTKKLVFAR